jgi:hypothetical protein
MTYGERVARAALAEFSRPVFEVPMGSNSGPRVRTYQASCSDELGGTRWPWCGAFCRWVYRSTNTPDDGLTSASTGTTAARARAKGAVISRPKVGAMLCWPGVHIGLIVEVLPGGLVRTVEGNSGDRVASRIRRPGDGGSIIIAPAVIRQEKDAPTPRRYYIERLDAPPRRLVGPWRSKAARERVIAKLPKRERDRVRRVRLRKGYGFEVGPPRILGPWADPDSRARAARALTARGERVRSFSRPAVRGPVAVDALGQTT